MAMKRDAKTPVKVKKDVRHKVVVEEGRHPIFGDPIPYKILHTEYVESLEKAKERKKELQEEYPGKSIFYHSL